MLIDLPDRLRSKIVLDEPGCWLWTGCQAPNGYGQARHGGRVQYVHRIVYELLVGPIPDGKQIDHLCRVRHCVNPVHLEAVTQATNIRRGNSPNAIAARTGLCSQGHRLAGDNLTSRGLKRGRRECRTCHNERQAAWHRRARAEGRIR